MRLPLGLDYRFSHNVWLMMAHTFLVFTGLGVFALIFNLYLASLSLREDFVGLFAFFSTAAIAGFAVPAGALSNRFSPRACLLVASLISGLAAAGVGLAESPLLLLAGGLLLGAANAAIFVPGGPFLMDNCSDDDRVKAFSVNFAVMAAASVLGSLASGFLPTLFSSTLSLGGAQSTMALRLTLMVGAFVLALGAVPMVLARPPQRQTEPGKPSAQAVTALGESQARRLLPAIAMAVFIIAIASGLILPFFNVYFSRQLGASVEQIGLIFAVGALLMVPCSLLGPALVKRFGSAGAVVFPRLVAVPFVLLPAVAPSLSMGALVYVMRASLMSPTWPLDNAFLMGLMPPRMRAMQAGIRSASWNVGWSIGSLVAGQLIVTVGYAVVFAASALLTLVGSIYFYLSFRRYQPEPAPSAEQEAGT